VTPRRPETVIVGQVLVEAHAAAVETAEAVGIAGGRVVAVGSRETVLAAAGPNATVVRADDAAVVPGLHDFHLHLVGMARARRTADFGRARTMDDIVLAVRDAAAGVPAGEWVRGDGWTAEALDRATLHRLEGVLAGRPALLRSHDRHSAWASAGALRRAGIDESPADPEGGRFERDAAGRLDGVLRERAADLVGEHAGRLSGESLAGALEEVVRELLRLGFTAVTDAGDAGAANGVGSFAPLGDSFSELAAASGILDGRLRVTLDIPAVAIDAARGAGLRSGVALDGAQTVRVGWAKVYADGALGSRTAAVFTPYRCGDEGSGILRHSPAQLDAVVAAAREARIGLAIHAIGDRAAAVVLDALGRGPRAAADAIPDRIEHLQLVRPADILRLAALDVTASLQPLHCPSDRDTAERCWPDRLEDAYPWASLAAAGARLAFGSDAPIETANPWLALHAAVHRRRPGEAAPGWLPGQALPIEAALAASTRGPAVGSGWSDVGHLHPGAWADLAVLSCDLGTLLEAGPALAGIGSIMTMVRGTVVHRA
jgi:predicted amidohydrolase YtcJ